MKYAIIGAHNATCLQSTAVFFATVLRYNEEEDHFTGDLAVKTSQGSNGAIIYPFTFSRSNIIKTACRVQSNQDLTYLVFPVYEGERGFELNDHIFKSAETMLRMAMLAYRDMEMRGLDTQARVLESKRAAILEDMQKLYPVAAK